MNNFTNHYYCDNCVTSWCDEECDSMHNDRCPDCDHEIEPYESTCNNTGEAIMHVERDFVDEMDRRLQAKQ